MKTEKYKLFNQKEKDLLTKSILAFLKPANVQIYIDEPSTVCCKETVNNKEIEYQQFLYPIRISSVRCIVYDHWSFKTTVDTIEQGWIIAHDYFDKCINNINSEAGKNLWDNKKKIIERLK